MCFSVFHVAICKEKCYSKNQALVFQDAPESESVHMISNFFRENTRNK